MRAFSVVVGALAGAVGIGQAAGTRTSERVQVIITQTEARPRGQRPAAYERILVGYPWSGRGRLALTRAFAEHAFRLSRYSGPNRPTFREDVWERLLTQASAIDRGDPAIAQALAKICMDRGDTRKALLVCTGWLGAHPGDHTATAWANWCRSGLAHRPGQRRPGAPLAQFDVHFCVITSKPQAHRVATEAQCRREITILNRKFRSRHGDMLVRFRFKSFTPYSKARRLGCRFVALGDSTATYDTDAYARVFNQCRHAPVRDRKAINFYIYDSYSSTRGFGDTTSHGKRNGERPYVLIDWQRLNNTEQNPEPHEMGHAFGLGHVGVLSATIATPTNIMASRAEEFGSGGTRVLAFTASQAAIILYRAKLTVARLRSQ